MEFGNFAWLQHVIQQHNPCSLTKWGTSEVERLFSTDPLKKKQSKAVQKKNKHM